MIVTVLVSAATGGLVGYIAGILAGKRAIDATKVTPDDLVAMQKAIKEDFLASIRGGFRRPPVNPAVQSQPGEAAPR